jgi:hypothetical protein
LIVPRLHGNELDRFLPVELLATGIGGRDRMIELARPIRAVGAGVIRVLQIRRTEGKL